MFMAQRIADLGPWFQTLDFGNGILSPGRWHPRQQGAEIAGWIPGAIAGKSLPDVGSNAGGIGIGLAELGASSVTLLEKGERYHRQAELYLQSRSLLPVQAVNGSAFDVHRMDRRDVTLWLVLVYHFRHPQLFLDHAAGCGGDLHVVSTPGHRSSGPHHDQPEAEIRGKPQSPSGMGTDAGRFPEDAGAGGA